jgi:signal transduction histidine kinase
VTTSESVFSEAASAVRNADDFEGLVRPLLEALQVASGYESTYFSLIDWDADRQEIKYSLNTGVLDLPEGLRVEWSDTLCRRALTGGPPVVEDASHTYADSDAARELGIKGYASVPVTLSDGETVGTLCGASTARVADNAGNRDLFAMFSVLIGQAYARERELDEERARAHAAEERLRNRLESVAAAEHMLKTPLTVLQGWARMFSRKGDELTAKQRAEGIEAIGRSADSMRELVDQLLASTRDDFRLGDDLHLQMVDIAPLLVQLTTAHSSAAAEQVWTSDITEGVFARVDVATFEQLISHLMDNAIKYGGPGATVHVIGHYANDGSPQVVVADTGPGMPEDLELFKPFARSTAPDRADSVGIGLSVVKALADAHSATVTLGRNEPHGAVATVTFPRS